MIEIIRKWCENLLVAVCISIIIEMLVPEGKNKKYIKVIIGIYIIFVTINPIFDLINYDINFDTFQNISSIETSVNNNIYDENIKNTYISAIEEAIKEEISNIGYEIESVHIFLDKNYENIEKIELKVLGEKNSINQVKPIIIGEEDVSIHYEEIENYLIQNYSIKKENIIFR